MNLAASPEYRTCYPCGLETTEPLAQCPRCHRPLFTARNMRIRGWLLAACGAFLLLFMGYITLQVADMTFHPGRPAAQSRYNGTPEMLYMIFGIFALVLAFGAASLWAGIYQVRKGRRNRKLIAVTLGLAAILFVAASALRWMK